MRIDELIRDMGLDHRTGSVDTPVLGLTDDSRRVRPGWTFIARPGIDRDGGAFIQDAVANGASAVLTGPIHPIKIPDSVCWYVAQRMDQAMTGMLAERFFGEPSKRLMLIGVTGTNGKTTTALLIQHLLRSAGVQTGVIGTVCIDDGTPGGRRPTSLTTPGAIEFSYHLSRMADVGCQAVVAEVSSHALDQGRAGALRFHTAVFTNLTQDHLDYHQTMDAYADAKSVLFKQLTDDGRAVVNADDPHAKKVLGGFTGPVLWTSLTDQTIDADGEVCRAQILKLKADASIARFRGPWGDIEVTLPLVGRHNVCNTLQAIAAAHTVTDVSPGLRETLETMPQVPGRLESVSLHRSEDADTQADHHDPEQTPAVLVDYAHTPDALENALSALRQVTTGRLIVMFGCGGDRDKTKRPIMAQTACRLADKVFLTSDNPRTEDPQAIIRDAMAGVPSEKEDSLTVIADRAQAIRASVMDAEVGDTVLLAGKGHEDYQTIGHENIHFDDREHAASALEDWVRRRVAS